MENTIMIIGNMLSFTKKKKLQKIIINNKKSEP